MGLEESGVPASAIELEVTESMFMDDAEKAIEIMQALKALGVGLSIDDFGTGYSSLAYLKRFPIHHLKIDREFVKDLPHDSHDIAIARSIIKMAHELQINVVAEGIEDHAQLSFLKEAECNYGQGFHFGKPMSAKAFEDWLTLFSQNNLTTLRAIK